MVHEPRSLLSDAYLLGELNGRNSLPAGGKKIYRNEPLPQRDFALAKNCARFNGEILFAGCAAIPLSIIEAVDCRESAVWAVIAIPKPDALEVLPARIFVFVLRQEIIKAGALGRHGRVIASHN
jgi:hypothetical protein